MASLNELNKIEEFPNEIVRNQPWKVALLEKTQKLTEGYVLKWLYLTSQISDDENDNKKNVDLFFEAVETLYEDLIVDANKLYEKHIEILGRSTEKLKTLERKLGLEPSVDIYKNGNLSLKKLIATLDMKISQLTKQEAEIEQQVKDSVLSRKLSVVDEAYSQSFSLPALEDLETKITTIEETYSSEDVEHLEKIKTENLENLIDIQKNRLSKLWDDCHCGGDVRNDFAIINTKEYNENTLRTFEKEVTKWQEYLDDNREILETVNTYNSVCDKLTEMRLNIDHNKLYENRGGAFSKEIRKMNFLESKMRKNEQALVRLSKQFLKYNGKPFISFGKTVEELIEKHNNLGKKVKCSSTPETPQNVARTPTYNRGKTPKTASAKSTHRLPAQCQKKAKKGSPALPKFKLNETRHSPPRKLRWKPSRLSLARKGIDEDSWTSDYCEFERQVISKDIPRSSGIEQ